MATSSLAVSPLAPSSLPDLPAIPGVTLATAACGLRYQGRPDLLLACFEEGTQAAIVTTKSSMAAAPILWCQSIQHHGTARALVVNAGNANACTGKNGEKAVEETVSAVTSLLSCSKEDVYIASTGVIGEPLDTTLITQALPELYKTQDETGWSDAAHSIATTDTFYKYVSQTAEIDGTTVTINGIAKGSGMIEPNMATMLGFIMTDAAIPAAVLQPLLNKFTDHSFNAITVDSDTSTNDMVGLFATGKAPHTAVTDISDPHLEGFTQALQDVATTLAQLIVRDGEGASKFITVNVNHATSEEEAKIIAKSIANSPLVKTAIAGEDPNWGRIFMAIGKTSASVDATKVSLTIGNTAVAKNGERVPGYDEAPVAAYMKGQDITLTIDLGIGESNATVWTSDLTHGYISINADYRS